MPVQESYAPWDHLEWQMLIRDKEKEMNFVHLSTNDGIAEVRLTRGKVNALNEQAVEEFADCFHQHGC